MTALCPKCKTPVIKRIITTKGDCVYDCYVCSDQIAEGAVIFSPKDKEIKQIFFLINFL